MIGLPCSICNGFYKFDYEIHYQIDVGETTAPPLVVLLYAPISDCYEQGSLVASVCIMLFMETV